MTRRTARWRAPPPKTLSLPTSQHIVECYACKGKAYIFGPLQGEISQLVLINAAGAIAYVRNKLWDPWDAEDRPEGEWRVLGWRSLSTPRHGDYDRVDPSMADFGKLQPPRPRFIGHTVARYMDAWANQGLSPAK
jgi:hypothetical protein